MAIKIYICPMSFRNNKSMKNLSNLCFALASVLILASCSKGKSSKGVPNDGQLHGSAPGNKFNLSKPTGMVYVPPGTFHMGPSDEDVNYAFTARNKQVSINGFWMDATEITNNEYRQFLYWVRDSIAAKLIGAPYVKQVDGVDAVDWNLVRKTPIKYGDKATIEKIDQIILTPENRVYGRKEVDATKMVFRSETFDVKEAARRENAGKPRSQFMVKKDVMVYPDTLVWVRDFSYSYNDPMRERYFAHPAFGNYPVVGVNWLQATAFCEWRTNYFNSFLISKKKSTESSFRLPTEAEWEYAARGGRSQSMFPWGNYYLRNRKGCLLANFKPGRGNYPEDGGFYTVRADAYWPNDFGLYNMAGNVAEWTSSLYYEGGYNFQHDMNPDIRYNAKDTDPPRMKRKVLRGGSWKDVGYFLQTGTRNYEYQDTAKAYIGFRCVIDLPATMRKGR
jgi:formylglycine-generating enzyme